MDKGKKSIKLDFGNSYDNLESLLNSFDNKPLSSCCSHHEAKNIIVLSSAVGAAESFVGNYINHEHAIISCGLLSSKTQKNGQAGLQVRYSKTESYRFYLSKYKNIYFLKIEGGIDKRNHQFIEQELSIESSYPVELKIKIESEKILFYYAVKRYRWHKLGASLTTSGIPNDGKNLVFGGLYVRPDLDKSMKASFTKLSLKQS